MSAEIEEPQVELTDAPEPESVELPVEPDTPQDPPEPEKKAFNPKTDKVEFSTPEQEARFKEIHYQLKKSDQRNLMLTDFLKDAVKQLDEVKGFTNEIRQEKTQAKEDEAENVLVNKLRAAHEEGDNDTFIKTLKELQNFNVKREAEKIFDQKVNDLVKKEQTETTDQAKYVESLMSEKDESGNFKRPWLQENHPEYKDALKELAVISMGYMGDPQQLQKSLNDLDQVMGSQMKKTEPPKEPPAQTRAPNPMQGSNLTNHKPKGTIKMSRTESEILKKLERHSGKKIDLKKYEARRTAMYEGMKGGR